MHTRGILDAPELVGSGIDTNSASTLVGISQEYGHGNHGVDLGRKIRPVLMNREGRTRTRRLLEQLCMVQHNIRTQYRLRHYDEVLVLERLQPSGRITVDVVCMNDR